jgi:LuxR family transcriptional regulator, maltose regulon positive regulatory protein
VLCLSQLAVLAIEKGDGEDAAMLAGRAARQARRHRFADDETPGLLYAVLALVHARAGRVDEARRNVRKAREVLAHLAEVTPWYAAEMRVVLALASIRLTDVPGARTLLRESSRVLRGSPDATVLREWVDDAWAQVDRYSVEALAGPSSLTTAELRVVRFLPSHLSFREIADRLHVSANTVKTQAHALYRKLDVASRSEAVARARRLGLIHS